MIKLRTLDGKKWIINIFIPFLLITPILWFSFPAVYQGAENLNMIGHFDKDESDLVEFGGKVYSQGLVATEAQVGYPQLFYYTAGAVLFPYTLSNGINFKIIAIGLRSLNVIVAIFTIFLLYFFCLKYFKSVGVAILSCALLITTPEYMWWIINSRPNLLEILFILLTFYCVFEMVENYNPKYYWSSILFASMANATKLGGIFLVPSIWLSYLYHDLKLKAGELAKYLKPRYMIIYFISLLAMIAGASIMSITIILFFRYQRLFAKLGVTDLRALMGTVNFQLFAVLIALLILGGLVWFIINMFIKRISNRNELIARYRFMFLLNKEILALAYIAASSFLFFSVFNPTYLIFPLETARNIGRQLGGVLGGGFGNLATSQSIFSLNNFIWFEMLFNKRLLGIYEGALFICYLVYEILFLKKNWERNRNFMLQRGLLWVYILFLFLVLFFLVRHKTHHYLLPISILLMLLTSFGIVEIVQKAKNNVLRFIFIILFGLIFSFGLCTRGIIIAQYRDLKVNKPNDTGMILGNWLAEKYSADKIIWKDDNIFYIPPKYNHVYYPKDANYDLLRTIKEINPDIIIITNTPQYNSLDSQKIDLAIRKGVLKNIRRLKYYVYKGPMARDASEYGNYKEVYVYAKVR